MKPPLYSRELEEYESYSQILKDSKENTFLMKGRKAELGIMKERGRIWFKKEVWWGFCGFFLSITAPKWDFPVSLLSMKVLDQMISESYRYVRVCCVYV